MTLTWTDVLEPYTTIHKAVRKLLFDLALTVGRADFTDPDELRAVSEAMGQAFVLLREHAHHESALYHTLLEERAPGSTASAEQHHADEEPALRDLEAALVAVERADVEDRVALGRVLHRRLGALLPGYLAHLQHEEEQLLPLVLTHLLPADVLAIRERMFAGTPPATMTVWAALLNDVANAEERALIAAMTG